MYLFNIYPDGDLYITGLNTYFMILRLSMEPIAILMN